MLGSAQRAGEFHRQQNYYQHLAVNNYLLEHSVYRPHQELLGKVHYSNQAVYPPSLEKSGVYVVGPEPTSVLDLWSPSPSSKGGCSSATLNNSNVNIRLSSPCSHESNTSERSVEDTRRTRDKSLDEWLADLQQGKQVEGVPVPVPVPIPIPASSSSNNTNRGFVSCPLPQQYAMEELEDMLLSPSSSSQLNQQQIAKWLLQELEEEQVPREEGSGFPFPFAAPVLPEVGFDQVFSTTQPFHHLESGQLGHVQQSRKLLPDRKRRQDFLQERYDPFQSSSSSSHMAFAVPLVASEMRVVAPPPRKLQRVHPAGQIPSTVSVPDEGLGLMDQLLQLAQAIDIGSSDDAQSILARLNQHLFCHQGKRIQRLAFYFKEALAARMHSSLSQTLPTFPDSPVDLFNKVRAYSSFLEVSPLLSFSYLTANQSILESLQGEPSMHIVDYDPRFGSQWSSLLQDLAAMQSPPSLKLTLVGPDLTRLTFVAESLRDFSVALGIVSLTEFRVVACDQPARMTPAMLGVCDGEALAFNFMFSLHRSLAVPDGAEAAVSAVVAASPRLVTIAEQEVDDSDGKFQRRFVETLQYYAFVLDSLGPEDGAGILTVEKDILAPDICNAVSQEGWRRTERHERLTAWKGRMSRGGFEPVPMSEITKMQADYLLKRHANSKSFEIVKQDGGLLLAWQGKPLVAVSAWTPAASASSAAGDNTHNNIC